ncbi:MAG: ComEC/Rec2 family competence protein [Candidatus Paceibacterota bacterium]
MPETENIHYKNYILLIIILFLSVVNVFLFWTDFQSSKRGLTFAMLDIGQGDGLFIESPNGTQIMFDAGPARSVLGPLARVTSPFDKTIDAIVITNPDADHIGGFIDILKNYKVGAVLEPGTFNDSKTYQNLKAEIQKQKIPNILVKKGMRLNMGHGVLIDILFPDRDVSTWNSNDGSAVARLSYGATSVMLTGDASVKTERIILEDNNLAQLKSTILKVGHHGSRTSSSTSFVKAVSPAYALVSDGKDNKYGHPHKETLTTLTQLGVKTLRTDLLGTIIMKSDGKNELFSFQK